MTDTVCRVEDVQLATELDQRMAFVSVTIGTVKVNGLTVWRSRNGHLRVFWPNYRAAYRWLPVIELEPELTTAIEAQAIATYKDAKAAAKKAA